MQKLILLFIFFLVAKASFSQQQYFVYIQSDDKQPFYVLLNGKTYSSSEYGHVILSKLGDSTHHISVGFPKKAYPDQTFTISINKKDAGYQLKNMGEKGWALFNLQTLNLIMSGSTASLEKKSPDFSGVKKTDEFSILLATVVNDSSILYSSTVVQQKPIPKTEPKLVVVADQKRDSLATVPLVTDTTHKKATASTVVTSSPGPQPATTDVATKPVTTSLPPSAVIVPVTPPIVKEEPIKKQPELVTKADSVTKKKDEIIKLKETNTGIGLNITFINRMDLQTDTIEISIPIEKAEEKTAVAIAVLPAKDTPEKKNIVQTDTPLVTTAVVAKADSVQAKKTSKPPPINNCKNYATEGDVDKLRVKILAAKTNAEKIDAVKKVYKTKCFSVRQVKALSELFKTDEERFLFFEASYSSVSDAYNFKELVSLLTEETYRNRFNEL